MKRRGFLGLLGLSPFGAKMAADDALVQMGFQHGSKIISAAAPLVGGMVEGDNGPNPIPESPEKSHRDWMIDKTQKLRRYISRNGIPNWKLAELRERAWMNPPPGIDPDLAVLQSMSPSRKAVLQRARNFERMKTMMVNRTLRQAAQARFAKKIGFDWYD